MVSSSFYMFFLVMIVFYLISPVRSSDVEALLSLKSSIDPTNSISWRGTDICNWEGVKECINGTRVSKLVLENMNLTGSLDQKSLNQLDQLRVLSFKGNSLSTSIPNISSLVNLKSIYLNENNFSGEFPDSLTSLHRLKTVVLAGNRFSGQIPSSLLRLPHLYTLYVQDNLFSGSIPPLNQTTLRFFNVSNNQLSGQIPSTLALDQFNESSFTSNSALCGDQIQNKCRKRNGTDGISSTQSAIPAMPIAKTRSKTKLIGTIAGRIGGGIVILFVTSLLLCLLVRRQRIKSKRGERRSKAVAESEGATGAETGGTNDRKNKRFSWEKGSEEGTVGTLVFLGRGEPDITVVRYTMDDLLKASAETLGRGTLGSTYKAVMESGFIVTVKRLKDMGFPRIKEFKSHIQILGRLKHPNLVPLRAYFQAKEECLLVYDYFPNGSLFSLIHGSRVSGRGKPLHWTSCLKIAEDLAMGLVYIHQNPSLTHGNLKSSNVLLGPDFESRLTDHGLSDLHNHDSVRENSPASFFYKAPECRDLHRASTQCADVYSFGVLLLELLTGRTSFQELVHEYGSDISRWVCAVREAETESGEELQALLSIAATCMAIQPENRPVMRDVLKMVKVARVEAAPFSSNSSDHSPGRWSDTVQSFPREDHMSI